MPTPEQNMIDHDSLTTLISEVGFLKEEIKKMSSSLENLKTSFVPRSEFDLVRIAVLGVMNDGGLMNRVEKLEKRFIWYLGAGAMVGIIIVALWQVILPSIAGKVSNTTINTSSK